MRELTPPVSGDSLDAVLKPLNGVLSGWFVWLKHADALRLRGLERRLRPRMGPSSGIVREGRGALRAHSTVPMMAARRLIEVRQIQDANKALLESLLSYVQAPSDTAVLLISGARLDADGARALVELGGGELSVLANDLDKCIDFVGQGGTVTRAVAEEVVANTSEADVWALTDALVSRDRDKARATLHRLLEDGEPSQVLEALAKANHAMNSSRAGDRRVFEALVLRLTGIQGRLGAEHVQDSEGGVSISMRFCLTG